MSDKTKTKETDEEEIVQITDETADKNGDGVADAIAGYPYGLETAIVEIDKSAPYHKKDAGKRIKMGLSVAKKMEANGWGKIISTSLKEENKKKAKAGKGATTMIAILMLAVGLLSFSPSPVKAQASVYKDLVNYQYSNRLTDTVTNAGTAIVQTGRIGGPGSVTLQVVLTELSGTTGGTLSVTGSLDGVNYRTIPTIDTQTAIATATATDVASQSFTWRFSVSSYLYYRVQWVGTGTMSATIGGKVLKH